MPSKPHADSSRPGHGFPGLLQAIPNWCWWKTLPGPTGRPSKRPEQSTKAPGMTFSAALRACTAVAGMGFMLTDGVKLPDGSTLIILDLDACRDPATGVLSPWAQEILDNYKMTCHEPSPGGFGLHILIAVRRPPKLLTISSKVRVSAAAPRGCKKHPELQVFGLGPACYVTMMGKCVGDILVVDDLSWLIEEFDLQVRHDERVAREIAATPATVGGAERIEARLREQGLQGLIDGRWHEHAGADGTASSAWWELVQHTVRAAAGNLSDALAFLLHRTAWGRGDIEESADPSKYARPEWVAKDVTRAAQKMPAVITDPSAVFDPLPDLPPKPKLLDAVLKPLRKTLFTVAPPARDYLLLRPASVVDGKPVPGGGFMPMGIAGLLSSAGGIGKTNLLTQLGVSVVTGRPWLNFTVNQNHVGRRVLMLLGEETTEEVERRIRAVDKHLNLTKAERAAVLEQLTVMPLYGRACTLAVPNRDTGVLTPTDLYKELLAYVMASPEPWGLIVFDPMARLFPGAESATTSGTSAMQLVEAFCRAPGSPLVKVAQHSSKTARRGGEVDTRGVTALPDAARMELLLHEAGGGVVELRQGKNNYSAPMDPVPLRRVEGSGMFRLATAEDVEAQEQAATEKGLSQVDRDLGRVVAALVKHGPMRATGLIAKKAGLAKSRALTAIEQGMQDGSIVKVGTNTRTQLYSVPAAPASGSGDDLSDLFQ